MVIIQYVKSISSEIDFPPTLHSFVLSFFVSSFLFLSFLCPPFISLSLSLSVVYSSMKTLKSVVHYNCLSIKCYVFLPQEEFMMEGTIHVSLK
jgi:hypothetical protein